MRIDHIGYAVRQIERAQEHFEILGFSFEQTINDYDRNVKLLFGNNGTYRIELVSRLDLNVESPIDRYVSNSFGTPYHICYLSEDLDRDILDLKKCGFKEVIPPAPAVGFAGRRVVFLMSVGLGLMEIVEANERKDEVKNDL